MENEMQKEFEIPSELMTLLRTPTQLRKVAGLLIKLAEVMENKEKIYNSTEECINFHLKQVGITESSVGYKFFMKSIYYIVDNYSAGSKVNLSKDVYPWVSEQFNNFTTAAIFEQMRRTLNAAWKYREEPSYRYFEGIISAKTGKPIVGKFLIRIAHSVRKDLREHSME